MTDDRDDTLIADIDRVIGEAIDSGEIDDLPRCTSCGSLDITGRERFGRSRGKHTEYFIDIECKACGHVERDTEGGV
jgi:uncharacterized Zn finger protein